VKACRLRNLPAFFRARSNQAQKHSVYNDIGLQARKARPPYGWFLSVLRTSFADRFSLIAWFAKLGWERRLK
jgi:hypothetical protein